MLQHLTNRLQTSSNGLLLRHPNMRKLIRPRLALNSKHTTCKMHQITQATNWDSKKIAIHIWSQQVIHRRQSSSDLRIFLHFYHKQNCSWFQGTRKILVNWDNRSQKGRKSKTEMYRVNENTENGRRVGQFTSTKEVVGKEETRKRWYRIYLDLLKDPKTKKTNNHQKHLIRPKNECLKISKSQVYGEPPHISRSPHEFFLMISEATQVAVQEGAFCWPGFTSSANENGSRNKRCQIPRKNTKLIKIH